MSSKPIVLPPTNESLQEGFLPAEDQHEPTEDEVCATCLDCTGQPAWKKYLWKGFAFCVPMPLTVGGTRVELHWSVLLLVAFNVWFLARLEVTTDEMSWAEALNISIPVSVVYVLSVVIHELAHAIVLKHVYGTDVRWIIIHGLGGSTIPRGGSAAMNMRKGQEAVVAFVGPLSNLILGLPPLLVVHYEYVRNVWSREFCLFVGIINVILAVLNMLPIFPMDGGRVVHGLLLICLNAFKANFATWTLSLAASGVAMAFSIRLGDPVMSSICGLAGLLAIANLYALIDSKRQEHKGTEINA